MAIGVAAVERVRLRNDGAPARLDARLALAGVLVCVAATVVAAVGAPSDAAVGRALLELLIVGLPIATGLYVLRAEINQGLAVALLTIGFAWSLTALSEVSPSVLYTIGRLSAWLVYPGLAYLLLAFPDGRVAGRLDRALRAYLVTVIVLLFLGTAPLVVAFPLHTPWATCTTDCPANAVALVSRPPVWLSKVILLREWMVGLFWIGLFVSMFRRWRDASPLRRIYVGPVFLTAFGVGLCQCAFITTRELGAPAATVEALGSGYTFCIVLTCGVMFFALVWRRTLRANANRRLGGALGASHASQAVRDALAEVLGDPTLQLLIRDPQSESWHDLSGGPAEPPDAAGGGRAARRIYDENGQPRAALVHNLAFSDDEELLDDAHEIVLASLRQEQAISNLVTAISELEESRYRIAQAAVLERARLERDLHDGAQQQIVAVRIRAAAAEELLKSNPAAGVQAIQQLGLLADRALAELRALARGVYPAVLTDRGLVDALRSVARDAAIPVHVSSNGVTRHPLDIETALYFTCLEAIQNALKHAAGATGVWITLNESDEWLRFTILDDGPGLTPAATDGRGLRNMRDRIEAVHGCLTVETTAGRGTRITGEVNVHQSPVSERATPQQPATSQPAPHHKRAQTRTKP